jgi:hypothetical protein
MGSAHNRDSQPPPGYGVLPYSYGYRGEEETFRTIMAYDCPEGCTRIPYFSNPGIYYNGQATGVSYSTDPLYSADNAHSIDGVLSTVANWRQNRESLKPPVAPANLKVSSVSPFAVSLQWENLSDEARGIAIERSKDNGSWYKVNQIDPAKTTYIDKILTPESHYSYRIYSFNGGGVSQYSNEAQAITLDARKIYLPLVSLLE